MYYSCFPSYKAPFIHQGHGLHFTIVLKFEEILNLEDVMFNMLYKIPYACYPIFNVISAYNYAERLQTSLQNKSHF